MPLAQFHFLCPITVLNIFSVEFCEIIIQKAAHVLDFYVDGNNPFYFLSLKNLLNNNNVEQNGLLRSYFFLNDLLSYIIE